MKPDSDHSDKYEQPQVSGGPFSHPMITAAGERRASVPLVSLRTLWFNTGTLCNLTCGSCYIESSPTNDRLVYLTASEVKEFLDEIEREDLPVTEIGFTGGEPFMNPDILEMIGDALGRGLKVLVLTNAMKPMIRCSTGLRRLNADHPDRLVIRVSIDHFTQARHEQERGPRSWQPMVDGIRWLSQNGFAIRIAGRTCWGDSESVLRNGYQRLFTELGLSLDAFDAEFLVLFPDMDNRREVPEITQKCWDVLGVAPDSVMCATSRMVVKCKGAAAPTVVSCTLIPYDTRFELGRTLTEASREVNLNHPYCAQFCVLGGGSCSTKQGRGTA